VSQNLSAHPYIGDHIFAKLSLWCIQECKIFLRERFIEWDRIGAVSVSFMLPEVNQSKKEEKIILAYKFGGFSV
jgi:hypothetical protein